MNEKSPSEAAGPVLLFDGECGLCHRVVRLLLRLDKYGTLRYASLQGGQAQEFLREQGLPTQEFSSVIFVPDWSHSTGSGQVRPREKNFLMHSDAVLAALRAAGGAGRTLATILNVFPRRMLDAAYSFVGRTRYKIFGPWRGCPLPRPEWEKRFLD